MTSRGGLLEGNGNKMRMFYRWIKLRKLISVYRTGFEMVDLLTQEILLSL